MLYATADYIIPVTSEPVKNGYVLANDDGVIISISKNRPEGNIPLQTFKGILVPGFINAHCHLELSYLKGQIEQGSGLTSFIRKILAIRNNFSPEIIKEEIIKAEQEMYDNGIVAVADISNDNYTFEQKSRNKIYYHTLLEAFDIVRERAGQVFKKCRDLGKQLEDGAPRNSSFSIVPHASYTVTPALFELIKNYSLAANSVQSIHNQECEEESELFIHKSGKMYELFEQMGTSMQEFRTTGKNSLRSVLPLMNLKSGILLVHNTYTAKEDIEWAEQYNKNVFWCFCPNANLYIENHLPQFENFILLNSKCCIGTDSLASNFSLSILDELKTITKHYPAIPLQTLIKWATLNGAQYLGIENSFGSFEGGKRPGINLIEEVDLENFKLTPFSKVRRIL